jgi:hypothetical protein
MSGPWDRFHIKFIPSPYLRPLLAFYLGREMKWLTAMALRPQHRGHSPRSETHAADQLRAATACYTSQTGLLRKI